MIKRLVFAVMTVTCLLVQNDSVQAKIVVSAVESIVDTIPGDPSSKTVTININAVTVPPVTTPPGFPGGNILYEQVGYYNFRVNLSGVGITGLSAQYNTTSAFSGLTRVDLDPGTAGVNPGIAGSQITFEAGSTTNIEVPTAADSPLNFIGTITFITTQNGDFNFSITPLTTPAGAATGFARNFPGPSVRPVDQELQPKVITVSGIVAVPEPSSIALIGIALAGFGGLQLRRRMSAVKA